jgi:tetratricopeptide (TPR) repeat protein
MRTLTRFRIIWLAVGMLAAAGSVRAADEPLADAKALYAAASFEDALAALGRLDALGGAAPAALEYKALCLLALGRTAEAQTVTASLISGAPTYMPADKDLSPRYVTLFSETRRQLLPTIAKRLFAEARDHFKAKNQTQALGEFEVVLALAADPVWKDLPEAGDLRTLAAGFVDLAESARPAAAPPDAPKTTTIAEVKAPVLTPPVPIRQALPRWVPPDLASGRREYNGAVRIVIGADGRVSNARIQAATHPLYDTLVLQQARTWLYTPATRDGQPVEVEKVLTVHLKANE